MFTRQASQIQNALRGSFQNQGSAQDMVQALCNCAQTLEHRGPTQFTYQDPWSGLYPSIQPPPGQIQPFQVAPTQAFQPITPGQVTIQMPEWKPLVWDNIPFVDVPDYRPQYNPYQPTPGQSAGFNPLITPWVPGTPNQMLGGLQTGNLSTGQVNAADVYTENVYNAGDTYVSGDTYVDGDTYVGGDTYVDGDTTNVGVVNNFNTVNNQGPTFHGGPTFHFAGAYFYGDTVVEGPLIIDNDITINNPIGGGPPVKLAFQRKRVVTGLRFQNNKLIASYADVKVLRKVIPLPDDEIFEVVLEGAMFDEDTCAVRPVVGQEIPQISYVSEINNLPLS